MEIAYQLYTSRKSLPLTAQFAFLKSIGYQNLELWPGAYLDAPKEFRKKMDDAGLAAPSILIADPGENDDIGFFIENVKTLGGRLIVRPGLPPSRRPTHPDGWKLLADRLSRDAERAHDAGLKFAWHNHDFEFTPLQDGLRPIDLMVEYSSPSVQLELDCGWVFQAGGDPLTELRRFGSRVISVHAKDAAPLGTTAEDGWVAHGDGVIDWDAIWPELKLNAVEFAVVEHDEPADWEYVARRSFESISGLMKKFAI
jgi:sugar phosphate isomerase/epimerase